VKKITYIASLIALLIIASSFISDDRKICIRQASTEFTTDNIGNIYLVNDNELLKYTFDGKLFRRYSNLKLGSIQSIDATNVLKPLLFYKDYQQLVFLDSQLSENSTVISLEKLGYEQTELACSSANNSFWIYSKQNNELVRFDQNSRKLLNTGNLKQLLKEEIEPNYMVEHNGHLFLNSPLQGIFEFDMFGTYVRTISLKNLSRFQVDESIIYFLKNKKFCNYQFTLFEEKCGGSIDEICIDIRYQSKRFYLQYKDSLVVKEKL
jgi:hypothetical protein